MALTISITNAGEADTVVDVSGVQFVHAALLLDSSYPAGGYPVTASRFFGPAGSRIYDVISTALAIRKNNGLSIQYDSINGRVRVFSVPASGSSAWTEVTATTNLSGTVIRCLALGY